MTVHCRTGTDAVPNRNQNARPERPAAVTVAAVDVGGTSTRAGWFAADGACLGIGRAAGGNPVSRGADAALAQVTAALSAAAGPAGRFPVDGRPRAVVVAMAGGSRADQPALGSAIAGLGLDVAPLLASDLLAGYLSGTAQPDGYGLVAGTGAAAIRVENGVETAVADGVGWLLGDRGSGFWIGLRAVQATMRALDSRAPLSALAAAVLRQEGIPADWPAGESRHPAVLPLVRLLYGAAPVDLARFARPAIEVAATGDPEAVAILQGAVVELVATLERVVRPEQPGPIVISGGVALALPGLTGALTDLQRSHGWPVAVRTARDGLLGAAVLAFRAAGLTVSETMYARMGAELTRRTAAPSPAGTQRSERVLHAPS